MDPRTVLPYSAERALRYEIERRALFLSQLLAAHALFRAEPSVAAIYNIPGGMLRRADVERLLTAFGERAVAELGLAPRLAR